MKINFEIDVNLEEIKYIINDWIEGKDVFRSTEHELFHANAELRYIGQKLRQILKEKIEEEEEEENEKDGESPNRH